MAFLLFSNISQPFSVYKDYVNANHLKLTALFGQIREDYPGQALLDENTLESAYMYYLLGSLVEDAGWFEERELENYSKTVNARTAEEARQGFIENVALEIVLQNAIILNAYPMEEEFWQYYEEYYNEEVSDAIGVRRCLGRSLSHRCATGRRWNGSCLPRLGPASRSSCGVKRKCHSRA